MCARLSAIVFATLASLTIFGSTGASAQGAQFFAVLNGGNECSPTGTCRAGDLDAVAYGSATVILKTTAPLRICWAILVTGIGNPTAAHIHAGTSGVKGGISVALTKPATGNPGAIAGCAATTATVINQIKANPSAFYINVHNAEFPDGALRGQLF